MYNLVYFFIIKNVMNFIGTTKKYETLEGFDQFY